MSRAPLTQLTIVWAALAGGVAAYTAVAFALLATGAVEFGVISAELVPLVAAPVMVYMAAGVFLRRWMIGRTPGDASSEVRLAHYRTATIVGLALIESGGIVVITVGMLASQPTWVLAGGAAACGTMMLARPTMDELEGG